MKGSEMRRWLGLGVVICLCLGAAVVQARAVEGVVFFDDNANAVLDAGDEVVPQAVVSDGCTIARTDETGSYRLTLDEEAEFIFLSVPSGARIAGSWYVPVTDGDVRADFALTRVDEEGPLVFVQISDIHYAPTPEEFKLGLRDRRMEILPDPILDAIAADIGAFDVDFVLVAGDLVADSKYPEPETVDRWMQMMSDRFTSDYSVPVYTAAGNHDVIRDEAIGKTIYESHFGPTYYSFNVKGAHCVVLDTQQLVGTKLIYTVDARQLAWLASDLESVDSNTRILVFCHEPTFDWADTEESRALFSLLQEFEITALLNGHWHTNEVLRTEPFFELTSGAACGAWWEGPGPDGTGFGYRVFRLGRGGLDSLWRTAGAERIEVPSPIGAVLLWADRLEASTWGGAESASYRWDDEDPIVLAPSWNGLWSTVSSNVNVSTLDDGYHTLTLSFALDDGRILEEERSYLIVNPDVPLAEIFDHQDTYQGKLIAAPELKVRAIMGSDISAYDETKTIIVSGFPYSVSRNDLIALVGMYHPTSTAPIKVYDDVFYTAFGDEDVE